MEKGIIYIVQHNELKNFYKIGRTTNWEQREMAYKRGYQETVSWTFESLNASLSEKLFHEYLLDKNVKLPKKGGGTEIEWFYLTTEELANIVNFNKLPLYLKWSFTKDLIPDAPNFSCNLNPYYEELIKTNDKFRKSLVNEALKNKVISSFQAYAIAIEKQVPRVKKITSINMFARKKHFKTVTSDIKREGVQIKTESFLNFVDLMHRTLKNQNKVSDYHIKVELCEEAVRLQEELRYWEEKKENLKPNH